MESVSVHSATKPKPPRKRARKKATEPKPRVRKRAGPAPNAFAYTIHDAQAMGAPSRTQIYAFAKAGKLKLIQNDGMQTMITGDSLRRLLKIEAA